MSLAAFVRATSHLRPRQVVHQIAHRAAGPARRPRQTRRGGFEALGVRSPVPDAEGSIRGDGRVVLLRQPGHDPVREGWEPPERDRLWLYTLHYHGWILSADGSPEPGRSALSSWIERHTSGVGWEPYPTARRVMSWIGWLARHRDALPRAEQRQILASLAAQCVHLSRHLEYHLDGNHLWTDLAALSLAGLALEGTLAERLRARWLPRLQRVVEEQVAGDGGHRERTPTYHCLLAQQLALVAAAGRDRGAPQPGLDAALDRMRAVLPAFTHPDGDVALWGDSQLDAPARPLRLARQAGRSLPAGSAEAPQSGFARRCWGPWTLLWNAGGVGMPHQVGHIHGDGLSIELSLGTERVLVDAGVGTYLRGAERDYARSTAAHNTATVGAGDPDQHELWASHRIGARVEPRDLEYRRDRVAGTLQGYRSPAPHRREVQLADGRVRCTDRVLGGRVPATVRYFLPSDVALEAQGDAWLARTPGGARFRIAPSPGSRLERSSALGWRAIGEPRPRTCLSASIPAAGLSVDFETLG